jgi:hypothetical protein
MSSRPKRTLTHWISTVAFGVSTVATALILWDWILLEIPSVIGLAIGVVGLIAVFIYSLTRWYEIKLADDS